MKSILYCLAITYLIISCSDNLEQELSYPESESKALDNRFKKFDLNVKAVFSIYSRLSDLLPDKKNIFFYFINYLLDDKD